MALPTTRVLKALEKAKKEEEPKKENDVKKELKVKDALDSNLVKSSPEKESATVQKKTVTKTEKKSKLGRTPTVDFERTERITFQLTEETFEALQIALPQEKRKAKKNGEGMDQGWLIEKAIREYLQKNNYNVKTLKH